MNNKKEVVKDNKIIKLIKLFVAITCLIASYFLVFSVKSDIQYMLYIIAIGPAIVGIELFRKNWLD